MEHLELVQERSLYKTSFDTLEAHLNQLGQTRPPPLSSCTPPNSVDIEAHYSFDYAQQVKALECACMYACVCE